MRPTGFTLAPCQSCRPAIRPCSRPSPSRCVNCGKRLAGRRSGTRQRNGLQRPDRTRCVRGPTPAVSPRRAGRCSGSRRRPQGLGWALGCPQPGADPGLALDPPGSKHCRIEGCPNKPRGGMCGTHRLHQQRYGDPLARRFSPKTHPDICSVEECGRPYRAPGLCKLHYGHHLAVRRASAA